MTRLRVDPVRCQGYAICAEELPHHFRLDDWGYAQAAARDLTASDGDVQEALSLCPVKAIRLALESPEPD